MNLKQRIKKISLQTNPQRTQQGRLAEDYDGIGQYVKVMLSAGSTSVAYKAKIAIGDFGTGQEIPAGTRVSLISIHGRLEIVSMGAK